MKMSKIDAGHEDTSGKIAFWKGPVALHPQSSIRHPRRAFSAVYVKERPFPDWGHPVRPNLIGHHGIVNIHIALCFTDARWIEIATRRPVASLKLTIAVAESMTPIAARNYLGCRP